MAICRYLIRIIRLLHELRFQITYQETENRRVLSVLRKEYADLIHYLSDQTAVETIYRDAEYAMEFIGISESTLARHQRKGDLAVAKMDKGKRYFRQQDLERFKKEYWNLPDQPFFHTCFALSLYFIRPSTVFFRTFYRAVTGRRTVITRWLHGKSPVNGRTVSE